MAYDKVIDSSVLDAGLKQIADAIREKGGTTDGLAFPQAMADAIAAIEAGGGSGGEGCKIVSGSFTPSEDISVGTNAYTIVENTGLEGPYSLCVVSTQSGAGAEYGFFGFFGFFLDDVFFSKASFHSGSYSSSGYTSSSTAYNATYRGKVKPIGSEIKICGASTSAKLVGGATYHWVAMKES